MYSKNILFSLFRGPFEEIAVHGEIIVTDGEKVLYQTSEMIGTYPVRSLLKPFQFITTGIALEEWEQNDRSRLTACVGSISATRGQITNLQNWYSTPERLHLISKLILPPSYPMDESHRVTLKGQGILPRTIFHTCFSKHMCILQGCIKNGWSLDSYHSLKHPYHKRLLGTLSELLKENLSIQSVTDGCLLPSPALSLLQIAKLYQRLSTAPSENALGKTRNLMLENPEWVGGPKRIDTLLMARNKNQLVAKEGADGLLGIGVLPSSKYPTGLGIVLKLALGYHPAYSAIALAPLLHFLELKGADEEPKGHTVRYHYKPFKKVDNTIIDLSPLINASLAVWPGDHHFSSEKSLDTCQGDNLTLSQIKTSVHLGTHTDAPNHFEKTEFGIDQVELEKYSGPCQVISVRKEKGTRILPLDIVSTPILAKRILFKTSSYPNPQKFNKDFVALSSELIDYLSENNVILVGIDTPSIDLFDSKDLPAHHATSKTQMAILEGVVLKDVEPDLYELSALPLKIEGADASPVRAVLRKI